jgi:bacterioferritin
MAMETSSEIVKLLNGLLTTELRAINQYFLDSKLAAHWGYGQLAKELRDASFEEMNDAEALMDRILLLGGLPNLQRVEAFTAGEDVQEQFHLAGELEAKAIEQLHAGINEAETSGDHGTAQMLREMLVEEERQLEWIETQLGLIETVGEANYLSQKINA